MISIVIPVFNVEEFLGSFLESALSQTYKNIELILVNDGSTDRSLSICELYSTRDRRCKIFNKSNGGAADARNFGINYCSGDYIMFADADDILDSRIIEVLLNNALTYKCDVTTCLFAPFYRKILQSKYKNNVRVIDHDEVQSMLLYQRSIAAAPFCKLYKKEVLSNIKFPSGISYGEDLDVTYKALGKASRIAVSNYIGYHYRQRPGSAMQANFTHKRMDSIRILENILKTITSKHPQQLSAIQNRIFAESVFVIITIPKDKKNINDFNKCIKLIKEYRRQVLFDNKSRMPYRFYALLSYAGVRVLIIIINLKGFIKKLRTKE